MSEVTWASTVLRKHVAPHGTMKERVRDAAIRLGWGHSRTKNVWYADERVRLRGQELRRITELTGLVYEGRQQLTEIDQLLERADALLDGPEAHIHRPMVAALRAFIDSLSAADRPGA